MIAIVLSGIAIAVVSASSSDGGTTVQTGSSDVTVAATSGQMPHAPTDTLPDGGRGGAASAPPPPCNTVDVGVDCTPITVCWATPLSPTGGIQQTYIGSFIQESTHGLGTPCTPTTQTTQPSLPSLVLRAFQRVPLPVSELSIQPPKGKTLVGLETIFSTKAAPFTKTLTLLNRQVQLRIRPASFVWHHGDGTTQQTDWAGKAWDHDSPDIDGYLTHVFEHAGTVRPSVEVTWEADYRVGTGAWQPVNGTVTRQGPATRLRIVEGQPVLNSY